MGPCSPAPLFCQPPLSFSLSITPTPAPGYTELPTIPQACPALLQSFPLAWNVLLPSLLVLKTSPSFEARLTPPPPHEAVSDAPVTHHRSVLRTRCTWLPESQWHPQLTPPTFPSLPLLAEGRNLADIKHGCCIEFNPRAGILKHNLSFFNQEYYANVRHCSLKWKCI